jgi:hypothetical protein
VRANDDDSARTYLEAAEKLAEEKRFEPALDMVKKASELKITAPALNIRLSQLHDTLLTGALVSRANNHLKQGEWRAAIDGAKEVLDRAPDNAEAVRIIGASRAALQVRQNVADSNRKEQARDGSLTLTSSPGATVYVDDEPIGRSPIVRHEIAPGRHIIQVRAQGHRPRQTEIKVSSGEAVALSLPLNAEPGPARRSGRQDDSTPPHQTGPALALRTAAATAPAESPRPEPEGPMTAPPAETPPPPPVRPAVPSSAAPAAPVAMAPRVVTPTAAPAPASSGNLLSAAPRSPVPKPTLPRVYDAKDPEQLARVLAAVEAATVSLAGVSGDYARGITGPLKRTVGGSGEVYPVALYYYIVREAYLKHDKKTAAGNLATAYANGLILKFKNLPAIETNL